MELHGHHIPDPLAKLQLGKKLGPLPRGAWLAIGGGGVIIVVVHRRKRAQAAAAGDPTVAGAVPTDTAGTQSMAAGGTPDSGSASAQYDPGTGGGGGVVPLGAGGVVGGRSQAPAGFSGTDTGNLFPDILPGSTDGLNNAHPGADGTQPSSYTDSHDTVTTNNYAGGTHAEAAKHHAATHAAIHAAKNGKGHPHPHGVTHPVHAGMVHTPSPLQRAANPPRAPHPSAHSTSHSHRQPPVRRHR